jgi:hypothetical protein
MIDLSSMSAKADGARIRREKANLGVVLAVGKGARRPAPFGSLGRRRRSFFCRSRASLFARVRAGAASAGFCSSLGDAEHEVRLPSAAGCCAMRCGCVAVAWFGRAGSRTSCRSACRRRRVLSPWTMAPRPAGKAAVLRFRHGKDAGSAVLSEPDASEPSPASGPDGAGAERRRISCWSRFSRGFRRPAATALDEARCLFSCPDLETCREEPATCLSGLADAAAGRTGLPGSQCVRSVLLYDMDLS